VTAFLLSTALSVMALIASENEDPMLPEMVGAGGLGKRQSPVEQRAIFSF